MVSALAQENMMMHGFDPLWLMFAIPGLLLGLYAQFKLSSTYKKYMQVGVASGLSGQATNFL